MEQNENNRMNLGFGECGCEEPVQQTESNRSIGAGRAELVRAELTGAGGLELVEFELERDLHS